MKTENSSMCSVYEASIKSYINRLESSTGIFICPLCDHFKGTSKPEVFSSHLSQHHTSRSIFCVYCACLFPRDSIISHIVSHFQKSTPTGLNSCPYTGCKFQTNSLETLRIHCSCNHLEKQPSYSCRHCPADVPSLDALDNHTRSRAIQLFHCPFDGCKVKSPSKSAVIEHAERVHELSSLSRIQSSLVVSFF